MPRRLPDPALPDPTDGPVPAPVRKGRGALANPASRFDSVRTEAFDDGWGNLEQGPEPLPTEVREEHGRTAISYNDSPDVGFDRSINPYRGCEHGCIYCFARPTHGYLGLSSGLDFETKLTAKVNLPELLAADLRKPRYEPAPLVVGPNTDAYQPIERKYELTRRCLQVLLDFRHPWGMLTKSALILRDLDLIAQGAALGLTQVMISVTTLDPAVARKMEPRAAAPQKRLEVIRALAQAGVPVGVLVAPVVPALTDHELERILAAAQEAGARRAGWVLLRLPHEIEELFAGWLRTHHPARADHVWNQLRDMRNGRTYDASFGTRMRGTGLQARLLQQRFDLACRRLGLNTERVVLDVSGFQPPRPRRDAKAGKGDQLDLFES